MATTNSYHQCIQQLQRTRGQGSLDRQKRRGIDAADSVLVCLLIAELVTVVESTVYDVAEHTRRSDRQRDRRTHFSSNYKTYS